MRTQLLLNKAEITWALPYTCSFSLLQNLKYNNSQREHDQRNNKDIGKTSYSFRCDGDGLNVTSNFTNLTSPTKRHIPTINTTQNNNYFYKIENYNYTLQYRLQTTGGVGMGAIQAQATAAKHFENGEYEAAANIWRGLIKAADERFNIAEESSIGIADKSNLIHPLNNLACAVGELGQHQEKLELLKRSMEIISEVYGVNHPHYAMALYNYAQTHGEMGDPGKMKEILLKSQEIQENKFGQNHAKVARVLLLLADAHDMLGEHKEQLAVSVRALPIVEKHCGPQHQQTCVALLGLARAYGANGNPEKQRSISQHVVNIQEESLGGNHPQIALTLIQLGISHGALGDHHQMKALLERAIEIQKRAFGTEHLKLIETYTVYGESHGNLKDWNEQRRWFLEAYRLSKLKYGDDHLKCVMAMGNVAYGNLACGDLEAAKKEATAVREKLKQYGICDNHTSMIRVNAVLEKLGVVMD
eukprot:Tbor_TRINITY_DN5930_c6_g5::TRINITY_DN5930_c6_g5_i1::g.18600::m.18600